MKMVQSGNRFVLIIVSALYSSVLFNWTKCTAAVIPLPQANDQIMWSYLAYELPRRLDKSELVDDPFLRIERAPAAVTVADKGSSVVLECEALGIPPPIIYWRKNGLRVKQSEHDKDSNLFEKLTNLGSRTVESSTTVGRLRIGCVDESTAGVYECVAENGYATLANATQLVVAPSLVSSVAACEPISGASSSSSLMSPPTIVMFTEFRFENEANSVQLFCRSSGFPAPKITWLTVDQKPVRMDENRYVLPNGDLFIRNIKGYAQYFCMASNEAGEDKVDTFVYATLAD